MSEITMKDMLLTTKDKLVELEKKLRQLRDLTYTECDKNIKEVRYVLLTSDKNPELSCVVVWNDKRIKGIINNMLLRRGLYVYGRESGLVFRDNNGNSHIDIDEYSLGILDSNQEKFREISDELLNDEFVREFLQEKSYYFSNKEAKPDGLVTLNPSSIDVIGCENLDTLLFNYYPIDNKSRLTNRYGNKISDEDLIELLNMPLDLSYLSDYQARFIESSPMRNKEIIVPRFSCESGHIDFDVEEDEKSLCLIKR